MSILSGNLSAQFLGGHRIKSDEDGPKGQFMMYGSLDYSKVTTHQAAAVQFQVHRLELDILSIIMT
jgi:hypothetical protein